VDCCSCSCASLVEKIALLERRICQLEEEESASIEKVERGLARRPHRASVSVSSAQGSLSAAPLAKAGTPPISGGKSLIIGDSVTRKVRLHTPANVICLPGARAPHIEANLRLLACGKDTYGVRLDAPTTDTSFYNVVIHAGTNEAIRSHKKQQS